MSTKRAKKKKQQVKRTLKLMGNGEQKDICAQFIPSSLPGFSAHQTLFLDVDMLNLNRFITPRMAEPVAALNKILDKYV